MIGRQLTLRLARARADAANDLRQNRERFAQNVAKAMRGGFVGSEQFDDVRVGR